MTISNPVEYFQAERMLNGLRSLNVRYVLGSHLPPAHGMADQLFQCLADARKAPAFVGPDQVELEKIPAA